MLNLGFISFAAPWILSAGIALPLIWLLLRVTPPAVTKVVFPAMLLLFGLKPTERTPARTPWWLVALRMLILALVLIGLARPLLNADRGDEAGPMLVLIDNGWAAAEQWAERISAARELVAAADRRGRAVALVTTAPPAAGEPAPPIAFENARAALARLAQVAPQPWPTDRARTLQDLAAVTVSERVQSFWFSDTVDGPGRTDLADRLRKMGTLSIITADASAPPLVLAAPQRTVGDGGVNRVEFTLNRVAPPDAALPAVAYTVRLMDGAANVLARTTLEFAAGRAAAGAGTSLPTELANRLARFDVEGHPGAAATILADDRWQRRPVGIVSGGPAGGAAPLLEDAFYIAQALGPSAEIRTGRVENLLARPLSLIFVASSTELSQAEAQAAADWVKRGGVLVRFAGPRLGALAGAAGMAAGAEAPLLPVNLRAGGGRNLGGALSWGEPAGLGPFPDNSPFALLEVPDDIVIRTQVLAEPSPDLPERTWAKLADGTPLVTARQDAAGWLVLFHVSATPDWSNLPLSGLFVDMLRKLMDVSRGVGGDDAAAPANLAPVSLLDGLGRLVPPGPTASAIPAAAFASTTAGPAHPPGLYGTADNRIALNLAPAVRGAQAIASWPAGVAVRDLSRLDVERDLKPWVLTVALILLLADLALSFGLRGLAPGAGLPSWRLTRRAATAAVAVTAVLAVTAVAIAQDTTPDAAIDPSVAAAILETRLAYVMTGSADVDRVSDAGLVALTRVLAARTSAEMRAPAGLDLSAPGLTADQLIPYPMIYWRITAGQNAPSAEAIAAVNHYLRGGGMIVFDAPDQVGAIGADARATAGSRLAEIVGRFDIPPLMELNDDHVLTRSFYLTNGLPGRYASGPIYVERGTNANDAVSSVVIGGRDWAAAWARDASGLPLFPMVPGGEQQREYAYRAGVNMVMYALTGNYKADQVHIPAIMQRLTQ